MITVEPIFTEEELDIISELLTVAQSALLKLADTHVALTGHSMLAERLRTHAERAADLREKLETR